MAHSPVQKVLFYLVRFLKKTSYHHKKKLITLVVIALLTYIAKKKLRFVHLIHMAQKITKIIQYLPLPTFPQYRKLNRYEEVKIGSLLKQVMGVMDVDGIKQRIKQKEADWNELKLQIFSGTVLSLVLYNIQIFYFTVQNKYEADFIELNSIETFEQMMGSIRKGFIQEIPLIFSTLKQHLKEEVDSIQIKTSYSLDDYFNFIDKMVNKVFEKRYTLIKKESQLIKNSPYKDQKSFQIAKNYFLTPYQYIEKKVSKFSQFTSKISKLTSIFRFRLFKNPVCEITQQRFSWAEIAYRIPLKKSVSEFKWANRQSELLSKLVLTQIDQMLSSVNFSTVLYESGQYFMKVLKNRLFLYFSKSNLSNLRTAESLSVFYKLIKEQIMIPDEEKRQRFYESEILKAIRQKKLEESKIAQQDKGPSLLIRQETKKQQSSKQREEQQYERKNQMRRQEEGQGEDEGQNEKPEIILLNMHLEEIYQARELGHLVKEFHIKYFNQRSGVALNPVQKQQNQAPPGSEQDDIKKLLSMLGDNQQLNKKD